jgi:hypothetical protein
VGCISKSFSNFLNLILRSRSAMKNHWSRSVLPALLLLVLPVMSMAQVGINISVNLAPPELPVYVQPAIPDDGYLWTPGYWAYGGDDQGYYWVPGTWVMAPQPGYLWTPGYWGNDGGSFVWNQGYWGEQIGFYGGVNYGFGYGGSGFQGGYWQGGHLFYNTAVMNVGSVRITNVYNKTVVDNVTTSRVSFNGGSGGIQARATSGELAAARAGHLPPTAAQEHQVQVARTNPALRASANHGNPPIAATAKPGVFTGAGVIAAKGASASERTEPKGESRQPKSAPVVHTTPTTERKPASVERNAEPVDHKAAPVAREARPTERKAEPVEHKAEPVDHKAAPVAREAPPTERKAEPVEHKAEPVDHKAAPVARAAPPAERKAEPSERKAEPAEHPVAPIARAAPPAEHKAEPGEHKPEQR